MLNVILSKHLFVSIFYLSKYFDCFVDVINIEELCAILHFAISHSYRREINQILPTICLGNIFVRMRCTFF
uniref:Uncharacterized protein n=1 Tax=Ascaris lumbricoides TaxID=6252 RepID=A0A0M3IP67_ASCLU